MRMKSLLLTIALVPLSVATLSAGILRPHTISFGKSMTVKLLIGPEEEQTVPIQVRALIVDTHAKEFVTGETHDVTDRLFVARRAFRLNNALPGDLHRLPNFIWQLGGWLLVDRQSGKVTQLTLADFDPFYSQASWYRDYTAYCGLSDNNEKLDAVIVQLGRKKPILHKELGKASQGETPDSECDAPTWESKPTRVTFHPKHFDKQSFSIFGHAYDAAPGSSEEEDSDK